LETENNILADLFGSVLSQLKMITSLETFKNFGIFQSLKFCVLREKNPSNALKLNSTPNTSGCFNRRCDYCGGEAKRDS